MLLSYDFQRPHCHPIHIYSPNQRVLFFFEEIIIINRIQNKEVEIYFPQFFHFIIPNQRDLIHLILNFHYSIFSLITTHFSFMCSLVMSTLIGYNPHWLTNSTQIQPFPPSFVVSYSSYLQQQSLINSFPMFFYTSLHFTNLVTKYYRYIYFSFINFFYIF